MFQLMNSSLFSVQLGSRRLVTIIFQAHFVDSTSMLLQQQMPRGSLCYFFICFYFLFFPQPTCESFFKLFKINRIPILAFLNGSFLIGSFSLSLSLSLPIGLLCSHLYIDLFIYQKISQTLFGTLQSMAVQRNGLWSCY